MTGSRWIDDAGPATALGLDRSAGAPVSGADAQEGSAAVSGLAATGTGGWRAAHAPPVSVVVPVRNEEPAALGAALRSVLAQDYPGAVEVVVADGSDAGRLGAVPPGVKVVANPGRIASAGLNAALRAASHGIVVRCDARCVLPRDYVRTAVAVLGRTGAANVGGRLRVRGERAFERAVAAAMTTPLGAGFPHYRFGRRARATDTVPLGVFRRAALEAAGGFDEALGKNEDYELNRRLRARGETVWYDPALSVTYRARGDLGALARQYFGYGRWKRAVLRRHPRSLRPRQAAAPLLVLALAGSAVLAAAVAGGSAVSGAGAGGGALLAVAGAAPAAYAAALLGAAAVVGIRRRLGLAALLLPAALAAMHLCWGAGLLFGRGGGERGER